MDKRGCLVRDSAVDRRRLRRLLLVIALSTIFLLLTGCASRVDTALSVRPDGTWSGDARWTFAAPARQTAGWRELLDLEVQEEAAALLGGLDIGYTWSKRSDASGVLYTFRLTGKDLASLSKILSNTRAAAEGIGGPAHLEVIAPVVAGQAIQVALPGNITTGYTWEPAAGESVLLEPEGAVESRQLADGQGALARQVLRFRATGTGQAVMSLAYLRPWVAAAAPTRSYTIQADGLDMAELLAAISVPQAAPTPSAPPPVPAGEARVGLEVLPTYFSWCDQGGCTPVKDQGGCGSCWAFGSVAPLESAIQLEDGMTTDLSEQYLVSCNTDGWGCNGGWRAHDYHWWKYAYPETEAGAVMEAAFPYVAWDAPCGGPYSHPYKITNWDYVAGYTIPSVDVLKQALYDYGPLTVSVCAGPLWNGYNGGVFSTDESSVCYPSYSNHSVTMVGWSDTDQAWIIKNSWGAGWGEAGYMRIRWNISNIGYAAAYIEYTPSSPADEFVFMPLIARNNPPIPGVPTLNDISNPGDDDFYCVDWDDVSSADYYQLQEDTNSGFSSPSQWDTTLSNKCFSGMAPGTYYYRVHACNAYGCSGWSNVESTTVSAGGWQTIVSTDFEGSFPGSWQVFDNGGYTGEYYWAKRNCRAYAGGYSGWAVGGGAQGGNLGCYSNYPNNAESWMMYGPFSLADAADADMSFMLWLYAESNADYAYWGASLDGNQFYGTWGTGNSNGWVPLTLDLTNVPTLGDLRGEPQVWVALVFLTGSQNTFAEGFYVDNIVLEKYVGAEAVPGAGPVPAVPPGLKLQAGSLSLVQGERPTGHTLSLDNQTGGPACLTVDGSGLGQTCASPGRVVYGSFPAGTYGYCLQACGVDECRSAAFPLGAWDLDARCANQGELDISFRRAVN